MTARFRPTATWTFNGIFTSGTANANGGLNMADFVLGYPNSYRGGGSQINNAWVHSVGLYAADVWRVSRRVTLNYGLRWEPFLSAKDANGFTTAFIRENFDKGIRSTVYPNAPIGLVFAGDPGFPDQRREHVEQAGAVCAAVRRWSGIRRATTPRRFAPAPGIYYDSPKLWETAHHMLNPPFGNTVNAIAPTVVPGQAQPERLPARLREHLGLDARRRSPGGLRPPGRTRHSAAAERDVPAERRLRQHAGGRRSDAGLSVEPVLPAAVPRRA